MTGRGRIGAATRWGKAPVIWIRSRAKATCQLNSSIAIKSAREATETMTYHDIPSTRSNHWSLRVARQSMKTTMPTSRRYSCLRTWRLPRRILATKSTSIIWAAHRYRRRLAIPEVTTWMWICKRTHESMHASTRLQSKTKTQTTETQTTRYTSKLTVSVTRRITIRCSVHRTRPLISVGRSHRIKYSVLKSNTLRVAYRTLRKVPTSNSLTPRSCCPRATRTKTRRKATANSTTPEKRIMNAIITTSNRKRQKDGRSASRNNHLQAAS